MMAYICDRCGKVIQRNPNPDKRPLRHVIDWGWAKYDDPEDCGEVTQIDVCNNCWQSFNEWRAKWQKEDKE